jgi:CarD family transcriptional regulator
MSIVHLVTSNGVPRVPPVGQVLVHPSHGTATVTGHEERDVEGEQRRYVVLQLSVGDLTLKVPEENLPMVGVRAPMSKKKAMEILKMLGEEPNESGGNANGGWARRFKANTELARTGDPVDLATVVRNIHARPEPSTAEKRLLDKSRALLVAELAAALKIDQDVALDKLTTALPPRPEQD